MNLIPRMWMIIGLGAVFVLALVLGSVAIRSALDKIERQAEKVAKLERDLEAERAARKADIVGLTTLSEGMVAATSARVVDEEALRETIDAKNPKPASPDLGAFLDRLRDSDRQVAGQPNPATGGAGRAAGSRAGNPGR